MAYCTIKHVYCKDAGTLTVQMRKELDGRNGVKVYTMCYAQHNDLPCPYDIENDVKIIRSFLTETKENEQESKQEELQ